MTLGSVPSKVPFRWIARYLDSIEIAEEALTGLILVLAFTSGAGLIVQKGHDATTRMLIGILGCNVGWGIIDGVIYVMGRMMGRARNVILIQSLQRTSNDDEALAVVGDELDARLEPLTSPEERKRFYQDILKKVRHLPPEKIRLEKSDVLGGIACFVLVVLTTLPAVVPFMVIRDRFVALRVSDALLLAMLFVVGYNWGRETHASAWRCGMAMLLGGLAMVVIVMALGG